MTTWNYIVGNEKDFEGAPEWATKRIKGEWSGKQSFCGLRDGHVHICGIGETMGEEMNMSYAHIVIAQRESVTSTTPVATDDSKYNRPCKGITIDVYDVLKAFNVTCPALQHLIKKALAVGQRGHKDASEDLKDILASAKRAIELSEGNK